MAKTVDNFTSAAKVKDRKSVAPFTLASQYDDQSLEKENKNPQSHVSAFDLRESLNKKFVHAETGNQGMLTLKQVGKTDSFSLVEDQNNLMSQRRNNSNVDMKHSLSGSSNPQRNCLNEIETPHSAIDVDESPSFNYQKRSLGGMSSQNSEDVKIFKSIQKKSKRRLVMDTDEDIDDDQ